MEIPKELYGRQIYLNEEERKELNLPEGEYEEVFPITKIPVFKNDIIQKGRRWVKIV